MIRLSLTKKVRKGAPREFVLAPFARPRCLPGALVGLLCSCLPSSGVSLSGGYFFRGSDRGRSAGERPFLGSAVRNRLLVHLSDAQLCDGETPHIFRVGLSNTLSLLGCSPEEIAQYLGWQSSDMARHYARDSQASSRLNLMESVCYGTGPNCCCHLFSSGKRPTDSLVT